MQNFNDSAYYSAATLALDLIEARPKLEDGAAADIAWRIWKSDEAPGPKAMFQGMYKEFEVIRAMKAIRSGSRERVEHSPSKLEKGLEALGRLPG